MDQHQQNRRRAVDAAGAGQNHPPPQPCPRCNSNNTKFCYYNNYSLSQPRFFCKGCRRYWTHGGTLRNVPVGGGCRKSKRPKLSSSAPASASETQSQLSLLSPPSQLPSHQLMINAQDHRQFSTVMSNNRINNDNNNNSNSSNATAVTAAAAAAAATMMSPFFGNVSSGFLSSLAAMQGVSQPLNFGPNLGLLHGFSLPSFETNHREPQLRNQDESFQSLFSTREVGSSSSMGDWTGLRMQPGPPTDEANNNSNNDNGNDNNGVNINQTHQWPDFLGGNGLDDP